MDSTRKKESELPNIGRSKKKKKIEICKHKQMIHFVKEM